MFVYPDRAETDQRKLYHEAGKIARQRGFYFSTESNFFRRIHQDRTERCGDKDAKHGDRQNDIATGKSPEECLIPLWFYYIKKQALFQCLKENA